MFYMNKFAHLTPSPSQHFIAQMKAKGFDPRDVIAAWKDPERITDVRKYPGQYRVIGNGVAIIGEPDETTGVFRFITIYLDGVLTPPRADQMNTPEGRRFADRYARGEGRG
jgi:hypothetical protein